MKSLSEILDEKSAGKDIFQLAVCKDDWLELEQLRVWLNELEVWCSQNEYTARFINATDPITIDGEEHANPFLKLSLVEFTKINES